MLNGEEKKSTSVLASLSHRAMESAKISNSLCRVKVNRTSTRYKSFEIGCGGSRNPSDTKRRTVRTNMIWLEWGGDGGVHLTTLLGFDHGRPLGPCDAFFSPHDKGLRVQHVRVLSLACWPSNGTRNVVRVFAVVGDDALRDLYACVRIKRVYHSTYAARVRFFRCRERRNHVRRTRLNGFRRGLVVWQHIIITIYNRCSYAK